MKKLSEEHYIIVDDSEIKIGDIVAEKLLTGDYELFTIHTLNDIDKSTQKKITYSTQPESLGMGWMQSIQPLFLSEVKELLGVVDVEKKAKEYYQKNLLSPYHGDTTKQDYIDIAVFFYNQALEDNKEKKYTEEDLRKIFIHGKQLGLTIAGSIRNGGDKPNQDMWFNESIESLQPKTEWEVEFVDGKLKLKS